MTLFPSHSQVELTPYVCVCVTLSLYTLFLFGISSLLSLLYAQLWLCLLGPGQRQQQKQHEEEVEGEAAWEPRTHWSGIHPVTMAGSGVPNTSMIPLWLLITVVTLAMMGALMCAIIFLPQHIHGVPHANLYVIGAVMAAETVALVLLMECMVGARIRELSLLLTEDALVVTGDPASFRRLERLPAFSVNEVDRLQVAVEQLYYGFAAELRRQGVMPHISYGGGAMGGETDIGHWDSDTSAADDGEEPGSKSHLLEEYLLSRRYRYMQKLNSVLQFPAETGSRATGFVRGLFGNMSLSTGAGESPPVDTDFYSMCSTPANVGGVVVSSTGTRGATTRRSSFWSAVSEEDEAGLYVNEVDNSGSCGDCTQPVMPLSAVERVECDPLDDNTNNSFEVLAKSLKFEGAIIFQVMKSIKVGRSLSSITLPVHILESRSLLEMFSDMFVCWDLLLPLALGEVQDSVDRMRVMLRWFVAAYSWRPKGVARKPYNPILGEVFQCKCPAPVCASRLQPQPQPQPQKQRQDGDEEGEGAAAAVALEVATSTARPALSNGLPCMRFLAEQVCHRPPVSAFYAELPDLIVAEGVFLPRSKMLSLNCVASVSCSSVVVRFPRTGWSCSFTLPNAYASGVVAGTPRLELGGVVQLQDLCSPAHATVAFLRKGFFGGQFDEVVATLSTADGSSTVEEYAGLWHGLVRRRCPAAADTTAPTSSRSSKRSGGREGKRTPAMVQLHE
ncbi:putative oxysterol-binding protein, partial [Trypanosoma grayi]|uniref:putative oxysterol-binding protein n=1 Tax=Trypanosoma grayi TaxID=71804 RepID=UPI0004F420AC